MRRGTVRGGRPLLGLFLLIGAAGSPAARADLLTVTVPGTADPWLAGMPAGATASAGDTAAAEAPVLVRGLNLAAGGVLTFQVTGSVLYEPGTPTDTPEGDAGLVVPHATGAENGISNLTAPVDSLIGVFLGPQPPNHAPAPAALEFATPEERAQSALAPLLQQAFFIGSGLTAAGTARQITIPAGATGFYLGTMDGFGWYNNVGSFTVQVGAGAGSDPPVAVAEPATWVLAGTGGLLALGRARRLRRRPGPETGPGSRGRGAHPR
jgi:hypothetical protein